MSSKYTRQVSHESHVNTVSINLSKVAGTLHHPNGITVNCQRPFSNENAVFSLAVGSSSTCQYPLFKSSVEKEQAASKHVGWHLFGAIETNLCE